MNRSSLLVAAIVLASAAAMCAGGISAAALPGGDPSPAATGSSQVSVTIPDPFTSASPSPSSSPSSPSHGGTGGGSGSTGGGSTPPACTPSPTSPPLAPAPAASPGALRLSKHTVSQRGQLVVTGDGFQPGEKVQLVLYPGPTRLDTFTARTTGQLFAQITIPARTTLGTHTIQALGWQDCFTAAGSLEIVSPRGSGSSSFPWIVWAVGGGGIGGGAILLCLGLAFGWLPNPFLRAISGASS